MEIEKEILDKLEKIDNKVNSLSETVIHFEGVLNSQKELIQVKLDNLQTNFERIDKATTRSHIRIDIVEKRMATWAGGLSAGMVLVGIFLKYVI